MKKITRSINVTTITAMMVNIETKSVEDHLITVIGTNDKDIKKQVEAFERSMGLKFVAETSRTVENRLYEMCEADFVTYGTYVGDGRLTDK